MNRVRHPTAQRPPLIAHLVVSHPDGPDAWFSMHGLTRRAIENKVPEALLDYVQKNQVTPDDLEFTLQWPH